MSEVLSLKMMKTNKVAQWGKVLAARPIDVICVQYPGPHGKALFYNSVRLTVRTSKL